MQATVGLYARYFSQATICTSQESRHMAGGESCYLIRQYSHSLVSMVLYLVWLHSDVSQPRGVAIKIRSQHEAQAPTYPDFSFKNHIWLKNLLVCNLL